MMRVMGYLDGVAYTVEADEDTTPDADRGIITSASPLAILAALIVRVGEEVPTALPGGGATVSLTSYEGILAGLRNASEVHVVTGYDEGQDEPYRASPVLH